MTGEINAVDLPLTGQSEAKNGVDDIKADLDALNVNTFVANGTEKPNEIINNKFRTVIDQVCKSSVIPKQAALSEAHAQLYSQLLVHIQELKEIPTTKAKNAPTAPLNQVEQAWLTRECLLRYLRATKWNLPDAIKRIEATLVWRREYEMEKLTETLVEPEALTGKQYVVGYDNAGRPCLYLNPSKQNTKPSPRQIQFLVWALERVVDLMPAGVETLALLVNFKSSSNSSNPSPGTGRQVLHILQNHYPERLGRALVINVPAFVWLFFKLITPFIDPMTREKLKFNEDLRLHVPPEQLDKAFGGDLDFEYEHEIYWPTLVKLATHRREAVFAKWKELGSKIGTSEIDLKADLDHYTEQ